jgi:pyruvate/2-oxoglutarate dehydrogenase complex dihydrolipoamide dehydrogenase (E3) component
MSYPGEEYDEEARSLLFPDDYQNPTPKGRYHLVVIGAGPAGLISAVVAAGLGAKVALVERHRMGGDCLNVGCVPSKALLEFTKHMPTPSFDEAFAWLRQVRAAIAPHDSVARYSELGVDVFLGSARFDESGEVRVGDAVLAARRVAICTGARADVPPIPGLIEANPLTNETVFDLEECPESLAILGAGPIGCELATVFARLGTQVHLFEMADRVLPLELEEASAAVAASLRDLGVQLHVGEPVGEVRSGTPRIVVSGDQEIACDQILVALGRRPNVEDLDLQNAGVAQDARGYIKSDGKLRTSNRRVYAAGDCTPRLQFTHHADAQARALVQNALFAPTASVDSLIVPHCTYTNPEVASVGTVPDGEADVYEVSFDDLDRGRAEPDGGGFVRVLTRKGTDKIEFASIVGHDAGEQLAPLCLLMANGLGLSAARPALIAYPTRAEYINRLADAYTRTRFTPTVARLFERWLNFTG